MPMIGFRPNSFANAARAYNRERSDHGVDAAIYRELFQNSLDAGATRIYVDLRETPEHLILEVRDNGSGMDWPTLEQGMLTYAGSIKPPGSVGGFGMAKVLLCFATAATEIYTRDLAVRIEGTEYRFIPSNGNVRGTRIVMYCNRREPDLSCRLEPSRYGLEYLLARSALRKCRITFNGETMRTMRTTLRGREPVRTWSWGAAVFHFQHSTPYQGPCGHEIPVCIRGLYMFSLSQPRDAKGAILINIDRDSRAVLNESRSNLADWECRSQLNAWIESLTRSPAATLRPKCVQKRFRGCGLQQATAEAVDGGRVPAYVPEVLYPGARRGAVLSHTLSALRGSGSTAVGDDAEYLSPSCPWPHDLLIRNERGRAVARHLLPQHMGPRVKRLLSVWARSVGLLLGLNQRNMAFGVGLLLSDKAAAMCQTDGTGVYWFLLNPYRQGKRLLRISNSDDFRDLLDSCAHEVAHFLNGDADGHGDDFVVEYGRQTILAGKYRSRFQRVRHSAGRPHAGQRAAVRTLAKPTSLAQQPLDRPDFLRCFRQLLDLARADQARSITWLLQCRSQRSRHAWLMVVARGTNNLLKTVLGLARHHRRHQDPLHWFFDELRACQRPRKFRFSMWRRPTVTRTLRHGVSVAVAPRASRGRVNVGSRCHRRWFAWRYSGP